jgi:hypothetical protein
MEAIFCGDEQEAARIEESAFSLNYGPLTECSTVTNFHSKRFTVIYKVFIKVVSRDSKVRQNSFPSSKRETGSRSGPDDSSALHQQVPSFRAKGGVSQTMPLCALLLKVLNPVPLPTNTPPKVRAEIFELLEN